MQSSRKIFRLQGSNFRAGSIAPITKAVLSFLALNKRGAPGGRTSYQNIKAKTKNSLLKKFAGYLQPGAPSIRSMDVRITFRTGREKKVKNRVTVLLLAGLMVIGSLSGCSSAANSHACLDIKASQKLALRMPRGSTMTDIKQLHKSILENLGAVHPSFFCQGSHPCRK